MAQISGNGNGQWQWLLSIIAGGAVVVGALVTFFVQNASLSTQVSLDASQLVTAQAALAAANERITVLRTDNAYYPHICNRDNAEGVSAKD
jgi:hypothetical protein